MIIREKCGTYAGSQHHERNKEKLCDDCKNAKRIYQKNLRHKNPEFNKKILAHSKKWRLANLDKKREWNRRYRAKKLNNKIENYSEKQVIELYGVNCYLCNKDIDLTAPRLSGKKGWENGLQIDHVIPISLNGADSIANVRPTHALCNIRKGAKLNFA